MLLLLLDCGFYCFLMLFFPFLLPPTQRGWARPIASVYWILFEIYWLFHLSLTFTFSFLFCRERIKFHSLHWIVTMKTGAAHWLSYTKICFWSVNWVFEFKWRISLLFCRFRVVCLRTTFFFALVFFIIIFVTLRKLFFLTWSPTRARRKTMLTQALHDSECGVEWRRKRSAIYCSLVLEREREGRKDRRMRESKKKGERRGQWCMNLFVIKLALIRPFSCSLQTRKSRREQGEGRRTIVKGFSVLFSPQSTINPKTTSLFMCLIWSHKKDSRMPFDETARKSSQSGPQELTRPTYVPERVPKTLAEWLEECK